MTFSTRNLDPLTLLTPKFPNFVIQILLFRSKHTVAVVAHGHVLKNIYTTWVRGVACQKTTFMTKIGGGLGQGSIQNIRDPLCISETVEDSNFKFGTQLGFGSSLPKNNVLDQNCRGSGPGEHPKIIWDPLRNFCNRCSQQLQTRYTNWVRDQLIKKQRFGPKLAGVWARGASENKWDPLLISATFEASNFKFGTQLGFGTSLPKNDVQDQNLRGFRLGEHPKKFGTPTYFCNR